MIYRYQTIGEMVAILVAMPFHETMWLNTRQAVAMSWFVVVTATHV